MRGVASIFWRELRSFVFSPVSYVVFAVFVFLSGFLFFELLGRYLQAHSEYQGLPARRLADAPTLNSWVVEAYWNTQVTFFVFLVPAPVCAVHLLPRRCRKPLFDPSCRCR